MTSTFDAQGIIVAAATATANQLATNINSARTVRSGGRWFSIGLIRFQAPLPPPPPLHTHTHSNGAVRLSSATC